METTFKTETFYAFFCGGLEKLAAKTSIDHLDLGRHAVWHYDSNIDDGLDTLCTPYEPTKGWLVSTKVACNDITLQRFSYERSTKQHTALVAHTLLADADESWILDPCNPKAGAYTNVPLTASEVRIHGFMLYQSSPEEPRGETVSVVVDVPLDDRDAVKKLLAARAKWTRMDGTVLAGEVAWYWPEAKFFKRSNAYTGEWHPFTPNLYLR